MGAVTGKRSDGTQPCAEVEKASFEPLGKRASGRRGWPSAWMTTSRSSSPWMTAAAAPRPRGTARIRRSCLAKVRRAALFYFCPVKVRRATLSHLCPAPCPCRQCRPALGLSSARAAVQFGAGRAVLRQARQRTGRTSRPFPARSTCLLHTAL